MPKHIAILTGPPGSGKTTTCCQLADLARRCGLDCAGLVCPARFEGLRKAGIDVLDLRSGERRSLAEADDLPGLLRTSSYRFHVSAIAWGSTVLASACPCDLLIIDEIGPLELERRQGWVNALNVLRAGRFKLAVVVVRPALLNPFERAMDRLPLSWFALPVSNKADLLTSVLSPIYSSNN